jgi:hypothetical protein
MWPVPVQWIDYPSGNMNKKGVEGLLVSEMMK